MTKIISILVFSLSLGLIIKFIPVTFAPQATITVTGEAKVDQAPQVGRFSASVSAFNVDKQTAVNEVNTKMEKLVKDVKDFGIDPKDIQTQSASVNEINNEAETMIYPPKLRRQSKGWQASNSVTLILRSIDKASGLTNLLQSRGATNVSGPSFSLDDTAEIQSDLLAETIADAKQKAQKAAAAGGRKLGKMITVNEGYSYNPMPLLRAGSAKMDSVVADAPVEPGSERVSQTATVVFELK